MVFGRDSIKVEGTVGGGLTISTYKDAASCAGIRNRYRGKFGEQQRGGNHQVDVELSRAPDMDTTCGVGDDDCMDSPGLAPPFLTVYAVAHSAAKPAQNAPKRCSTV